MNNQQGRKFHFSLSSLAEAATRHVSSGYAFDAETLESYFCGTTSPVRSVFNRARRQRGPLFIELGARGTADGGYLIIFARYNSERLQTVPARMKNIEISINGVDRRIRNSNERGSEFRRVAVNRNHFSGRRNTSRRRRNKTVDTQLAAD